MKKSVWAKMLSLALVFVCVIGLAACGGGDSSAAGSYKLHPLCGIQLIYISELRPVSSHLRFSAASASASRVTP